MCIRDRYRDSIEEVVIPETYNGRTVTQIAEAGFQSCRNLKTVSMPDTITTIKSSAFQYCESLTSINLSKSLQTIETESAFGSCTSLTTLTIPASLTEIANSSFGNTGLQTVYFEETTGWQRQGTGEDWETWYDIEPEVLADPAQAAELLSYTWFGEIYHSYAFRRIVN